MMLRVFSIEIELVVNWFCVKIPVFP
ncbi:hypothetical protein FWK35_00003028 [Aphis craccivora]|uniref:Uncharacterized protein n=1 Tax=Aphis craccivora TaxID=307492 RepID=A0A6G0ZG65_APHCR|nr:hypothetical protein FWK35_00003028 [Aphis craccivora]